jgi:starch synthase (maltosyl-transferring)
MTRLALAATLSSNYGIYGPAYELGDHQPMHEKSEEYLNSEKYEMRVWNLKAKHSLKDFITKINKIRHANVALQSNANTNFHESGNDQVLCFTKHTDDHSNIIMTVANLDFVNTQSATLTLPFEGKVTDLISGRRLNQNEAQLQVTLNPAEQPVMILKIEGARKNRAK